MDGWLAGLPRCGDEWLVACWLLAGRSFGCLVCLLAEWLSWLDCLWSRTGLARNFVFHFSFFFTGRVGVDAAANGLHFIQNDIFVAEISVDTDEIEPSQGSATYD